MCIYVWAGARESAVSVEFGNLNGGEEDDHDGGQGYDERGNENRWGAARKS
jgi:hypothetical protein